MSGSVLRVPDEDGAAGMDEGAEAGREAGLEAELAATEERLDAALKASAALVRELKKAKAGAARGQIRDLRRALGAAADLGADSAKAAQTAAESFALDEQGYLTSGDYTRELLAAAQARGVTMVESDDRLLCYPSLIRVLPGDAAVEIDRRRERRLRPSVLVDLLAAAQSRPPRFKPEPFLESLQAGYELALAREARPDNAVVRLVDVWAVLTLLPGQQREYTKPEFARDLYLLDSSGVNTTRLGRSLRWQASTGSKGAGTLTTVAKTGQQQLYWGISFTSPS